MCAGFPCLCRGAPVCAPEIGNRRFPRIKRFDRTTRLGRTRGFAPTGQGDVAKRFLNRTVSKRTGSLALFRHGTAKLVENWLFPIHPLLTNTRLFSIIHRNAKFSKTRIRCNKKMCLSHFRYDAQKCMF